MTEAVFCGLIKSLQPSWNDVAMWTESHVAMHRSAPFITHFNKGCKTITETSPKPPISLV